MRYLFEGNTIGLSIAAACRHVSLYLTCNPYMWAFLCAISQLSPYFDSLLVTVHIVDKRVPTSNVNSRELCRQTMDSCQFYSHCMESLFPCGSMGFALSYAQKRCESIRRLHSSCEGCSTCIQDTGVLNWAKATEDCLRRRLYLLTGEFHNSTSDPPTCLHLERKAIAELNACYQDTRPGLCPALETSDAPTLQQDLSRVVNAFSVSGDYYSRIAEPGVARAIENCSHPNSSVVAGSLISRHLPRRVLLCVNVTRYNRNHPTTAVKMSPDQLRQDIASHLSQPLEELVYSGLDSDRSCSSSTPPKELPVVLEDQEWHFLTLFAPPNASLLNETIANFSHGPSGYSVYFEYESQREPTLCGDGLRQAGELCDYSGTAFSSCDFSCSPRPSIECSVERLQPSSCWSELCGDGCRTSSEECDDSNTHSNDGCSADCRIETPYECTNIYNRTSECRVKPSKEPPTLLQSSSTTSSDLSQLPTPRASPLPTSSSLFSTPHVLSTESLSSHIMDSTSTLPKPTNTLLSTSTSSARPVISRTVKSLQTLQTLLLALVVLLVLTCR